jgi:hypothetical protein
MSRTQPLLLEALDARPEKPALRIATSGPEVSNLVTGLAKATTEGDPVIALGVL